MAKFIKYLVISLISLMLIIAILIIGLVTFVNPNNFKDDISQQVFKATGRTLTINGDIQWSFFPWVGLEVNDATLSNAVGFGQMPFAELGHAKASLKVLPLFSGKIQAGTLSIQDLTLNLMKNTQGQNNWQDMAKSKKTSSTKNLPVSPTQASETQSTDKKLQLLVSNISLHNIIINWDDAQMQIHHRYAIEQLQSQDINVKGDRFPLSLTAYTQNNTTNQKITLTLKTNLQINLNKQIANLNDLSMELNQLKLNGQLTINHILTGQLAFQGKINIPTLNAATLINSINPQITFANPQALKTVDANLQFSGTENSLNIPTIKANIDNTTLNGSADISNLKKLIGHFNLAINAINLDDYQIKQQETAKTVQTTKTKMAKNSIESVSKPTNNNTYKIPFEYASLNGEVKANSIIFNKVQLTNVSSLINIQQGVFAIGPLTANVYGGKLRANLIADCTKSKTKYHISETLNNVQIQSLIIAVNGKSRLSGIANVNANLSAQGMNNTALLRSLTGTAGFSIQNGKIQGFHLMQAVNTAASLFFRQPANNVENKPTTFTNTAATLTINNGIASTNDLVLNSPVIKVTGKGNIDLVTQKLDMSMDVTALTNNIPAVTKLQDAVGGTIPLKIQGTLSHPQVSPNMNNMTLQATKEKVGKQLKHIGEDLNKTSKDLGKQIKSLFN